jgi:RNA polymerase sigma-70 factor (ECF subfamily)
VTADEALDTARELGIALDAAALADAPQRGFERALADACMLGNPRAVGYFERTYVAAARHALGRLGLPPALIDDVLGWLRGELFARPEGALLASYTGRGALAAWLRTIAVHEAVKRQRRARREVASERLDELPMAEPAFAAMRGAYRTEFTRAMADSFAALTTQDRNLLRQYFLDGLTIDMLAGLYQIHRATAARRLAAARTALATGVRARLVAELGLSEAGVDEVITLSNLDDSLGQLLRATP